MTIHNKEIWINAGYQLFSLYGFNGLKIEPLSKNIGISKSSFYHYFADLELFMDFLLKHHVKQSKLIAVKERNARNIDPELVNILIEHKTDLLFNRQLRIHQNIKSYASTLEESNKNVGDAFLTVWIKDLGLQLSNTQIEALYTLALENFFLQINIDTLNYDWLSNYFKDLKKIAGTFISST